MNGAQWLQLIAVLVGSGGVSSGFMALVLLRQRKRKMEADTARVAVTVLNTVIQSLTAENVRLKTRCDDVEAENDELREVIRAIGDRKNVVTLPPEGVKH